MSPPGIGFQPITEEEIQALRVGQLTNRVNWFARRAWMTGLRTSFDTALDDGERIIEIVSPKLASSWAQSAPPVTHSPPTGIQENSFGTPSDVASTDADYFRSRDL